MVYNKIQNFKQQSILENKLIILILINLTFNIKNFFNTNAILTMLKYCFHIIFFFLFLNTSNAYAYIDPVTTSFIFKAIVSAVVACVVVIKRIRDKILSIFRISKRKDDNVDDKKNLK